MFFSKKLNKIKNLNHCFFSRKGGYSSGIYKSLNCGIGSSDKKEKVIKNLKKVSKKMGCKKNCLIIMNQCHSNHVIYLDKKKIKKNKIKGDALVTKKKNTGICILTADCVPILLYDYKKKIIGCIHSGWKGALNGIIENTIKKLLELNSSSKNIIAAVGPCIQKKNYNVDKKFYKKFINKNLEYKKFFTSDGKEKYFFNLRKFVIQKLKNLNIKNIDNIEKDTFSDKKNFFSYRRSIVNKEKDYGRCISVILMT